MGEFIVIWGAIVSISYSIVMSCSLGLVPESFVDKFILKINSCPAPMPAPVV